MESLTHRQLQSPVFGKERRPVKTVCPLVKFIFGPCTESKEWLQNTQCRTCLKISPVHDFHVSVKIHHPYSGSDIPAPQRLNFSCQKSSRPRKVFATISNRPPPSFFNSIGINIVIGFNRSELHRSVCRFPDPLVKGYLFNLICVRILAGKFLSNNP
jgi:hypothetical protein